MSTKLCRDCGEVKPLDEFYDHPETKDRRGTYCKLCANARSLESKKTNPKQVEKNRRANLKMRYGITLEQYDEMFANQGSICACCGATEPGGKGWQIDHCHDTGELRGILCHGCNTGIGLLGDNVDGVWQAILYLVKHEQKGLVA